MKLGWLKKAAILFGKIVWNAGREKIDEIVNEPKKPAKPAARKGSKK